VNQARGAIALLDFELAVSRDGIDHLRERGIVGEAE
jgi:hypothetical protein